MSDTKDRYQQIFANNDLWIAEKTAADKDYFVRLAQDQQPDFLYIGCSDSRVPANEIMGLGPGEVFVHRNVANLVDNSDMNVQAVIQYAVEYLKVKYIVVCGHYGCGGIKAAMHPTDMGLLSCWLHDVTDVYRMHYEELSAITDQEQRYRRLVELNVEEQCLNVVKAAYVQKSFQENKLIGVYGWVYDLHDGKLVDLRVDVAAMVRKNLDIIAKQSFRS